MAIPEQFIDELVARSDIADVVSSYVHLTQKGGNLWGLCPFHNEKTPSFAVSPDKQIYHCFGCGKGGGVISFIMEMENLSYPDAIRLLAQRAGMEVPDTGTDEAGRKKRARICLLYTSSPQPRKGRRYSSRAWWTATSRPWRASRWWTSRPTG